MLKERFMIIVPNKCEFNVHTTDYIQGPDESTCNDPAPFMLCYGGGGGDQPHTIIWACEYHRDEQEEQEAKDAGEE